MVNMFTVYVLQNEKGKIYIGQTEDLQARMRRHTLQAKSKRTSYTYKNHGDWRIVYTEEYPTRQEAIKREKQLKTAAGRKFIKSKIENLK